MNTMNRINGLNDSTMTNIGTVINKTAYFPFSQKLVIIIGANGTGKTLLLDALYRYLIDNGQNVEYFNDTLFCQKDSKQLATSFETDYVTNQLMQSEKYNNIGMFNEQLMYEIECLKKKNYKDCFYENGIRKYISLMGTAASVDNGTLLVDEIETMFSFIAQRNMLKTLLAFDNIKRIVVTTHSPSILAGYHHHIKEIDELLIRE